jgi:hypothetical protein
MPVRILTELAGMILDNLLTLLIKIAKEHKTTHLTGRIMNERGVKRDEALKNIIEV